MTITLWRPNTISSLFSRSMSDFLDDFFDTGSIMSSPSRSGVFCPLADSYVKDNTVHVRMDLPGVDPEDVRVTMKDGCLRISGERKRSRSEENVSYHMEEMSYGCFSRSFSLPEGTDTEKIHASFDKGVLEVTIPLPESAMEKKIPVQGVASSEAKSMKSQERSGELPEAKEGASSGEKPAPESTSV